MHGRLAVAAFSFTVALACAWRVRLCLLRTADRDHPARLVIPSELSTPTTLSRQSGPRYWRRVHVPPNSAAPGLQPPSSTTVSVSFSPDARHA